MTRLGVRRNHDQRNARAVSKEIERLYISRVVITAALIYRYEDRGNGTNHSNTPFTIPPTSQRSIGDVLLENNISWKSYNDQWDRYLTDKYQLNYGKVGPQSDQYCNICNGFQYQTQIMTNDAVRTAHITDTDQLYKDMKNGKLPAVSFVKPSGSRLFTVSSPLPPTNVFKVQPGHIGDSSYRLHG